MKKIRVLVVDDSLTVRKRLVEVLSAAPEIEVVGEGETGRDAIELCLSLRPDVITLDMMLPVMSGLAATEYIMAHCPTPILIVSSSVNRGELYHTYDALAAGAVDVLDKANTADVEDWEERFVATVKLVSRVKVITHVRARLRPRSNAAPGPSTAPAPLLEGTPGLIAIGASTGGPGAIRHILEDLPAPCPLPILVVLHIAAPFAVAFAEWLDSVTPHTVVCARGGESLDSLAGRVVLSPADRHLVVRGRRLQLTDGPPRHSCKPSVDELFESLAVEVGSSTVACLLTGMGRDGAAGLLAIRRAGGTTIAQDEASSVVYGMPREAALIGAAARVLPLSGIAPALAALGRRRA